MAAPPHPLPPLVSALMDPACYPHPVERVTLMETHGAWVLLAGDFAYKIKKPVCLPFMDFGTLEQRRVACEAEVRLNRRFETEDRDSHIYLGVLPITGTLESLQWGTALADEARAIEFAVHMRRFDEADRLDHLCDRGALTAGHVLGLARRMAQFQSHAPNAAPDEPWGKPEQALAFARDNFDQPKTALAEPEDQQQLQALSDWTELQGQLRLPVLTQRRSKGRVQEGHGDLHLANLVLINGEVVPFDGIEFNEALRWIDVASEMAFPWMDLHDHGRPGLANVLLSEWLDASGDADAPLVLPFFAVYRAMVRAKVAAIRSRQPGADVPVALALVRRYLALAQHLTQPPAPRLVITHGLSGSGKTWASSRWLEAEPTGRAIRLRSDVARKHLHGLAAQQASGSGLNTGLYAPPAHALTYHHLLQQARSLLQKGWTVLVDAAFLRRHERASFAALAHDLRCPFHILAPQAPVEQLRDRIRARQAQGGDASEATLDVLEQQLTWLEPLDDTERARCLPTPG